MKRKGEKMVFRYSTPVQKDGYIDNKSNRLVYTGEYTKIYNNAFNVIVECSRCSQLLFLFLTDVMSDKGVVYNNDITRNEFMLFVYNKYGKSLFTENTIKSAFKELRDLELLIEYSRGIMYVNPVYFWKGDSKSRKEAAEEAFKNKYKGLKVTIEQ